MYCRWRKKIRVISKLERIGQRRDDAIKIQFIDTPVSYRKVPLPPCINREHIFPAISIDDGKLKLRSCLIRHVAEKSNWWKAGAR